MSALLPFRDINVHASSTHYAFSSPSSPSAPTLVVERPSGDIRLHDGKLLGGQRVTSIQGILGIISLRLGMFFVLQHSFKSLIFSRQVHCCNHKGSGYGQDKGPSNLQSRCY